MQLLKSVNLPSSRCEILISDEPTALLAAKAAKRAVVGYSPDGRYLPGARYVVEDLDSADEEFLERVARRHLGLPWIICETRRLTIRELTMEDAPCLGALFGGNEEAGRERLAAYIRCQYPFYEYGMWGLEAKARDGAAGGALVGWAGFSLWETKEGDALELGYHIREPFRRQGYAKEACRAVLDYGENRLGITQAVCRIARSNQASIRTALGLNVRVIWLDEASKPEEDPDE